MFIWPHNELQIAKITSMHSSVLAGLVFEITLVNVEFFRIKYGREYVNKFTMKNVWYTIKNGNII